MPTRARNFFGRVVDGVLPGNQYDRSTGQYSNIASGITGFVANRIAPGLGTIGTRLWEARNGRNLSPTNMTQPPMGVNVPDANGEVQSQWGSINGGLSRLASYGPNQGSYGYGPPPPTTSGLPNTQTTYGVSLPNYGGMPGGGPQAPVLTPQQQAEQDRIAKNNSYGGPSTFASPNNRQSGANIWGHRYEN